MLFRNFGRALQVGSVLLRRIVLPGVLPTSRRKVDWPARWRETLEELGGAWIKLGQALALRFDILPPPYCYEFFKLLNQMRPFSYAEVRQIIGNELKGDPESLFREFEREPFAAVTAVSPWLYARPGVSLAAS